VDIQANGQTSCSVAVPENGWISFDNVAFPAAATYTT
jgi:hypothetical protein